MKLRNKQPTTLECCWENTLFRSRLRWYLLIRWCSPAQPKLGSVNKQTGCLIKCKRIFGSQLSQKESPFLIWQNRYIPNQGDEANDFSGLFSTTSETFVNGRKARHVELGLDAYWCLETTAYFFCFYFVFSPLRNVPFDCLCYFSKSKCEG